MLFITTEISHVGRFKSVFFFNLSPLFLFLWSFILVTSSTLDMFCHFISPSFLITELSFSALLFWWLLWGLWTVSLMYYNLPHDPMLFCVRYENIIIIGLHFCLSVCDKVFICLLHWFCFVWIVNNVLKRFE